MNVICVYRSHRFSPNMVDNDARILNAVADRLQQRGYRVRRVHEEQLGETIAEMPDIVYTMGREDCTLGILQEWESQGTTLVVNSSSGIRNCERKRFTQILTDEDVPFPESRVFCSSDSVSWDLFPCWLKKGEGYAEVAEDVMYVQNYEALEEGVEQMKERGIETLVISQHLEGDLIKCYGVKDTPFFYWHYASDGHSKFGFERMNGKEQGYAFSEVQLQRICNHAATVLGIDVYGGDCVIDKNGTIRMIDINDWPSFSCCREQAAETIIRLIGY